MESIDDPIVFIEDGRIARLGTRAEIPIPEGAEHRDFPEAIIAPGYIDLHVHGGAGHDVMEASDAALESISRHLAKTGVTSFCPTTVTASIDATLRAVEHLAQAIQKQSLPGAQAIGIHLEGPFISKAKCGVHPVADIREPSIELLERLWQASGATIKLITLAPELPGAVEFTKACLAKKIVVSLGHSDAETTATLACMEAGASHATHTFNAMRALDHREPGILGVVLSDDRVSADIIVDGIHVAPEMVKLFLRAKGSDKAVLITDAISATGMAPGRYKLGGFDVDVEGDRCMLNGRLAGSVLRLDQAVRNLATFSGCGLDVGVRCATVNAARVLGLGCALREGEAADLNVIDESGTILATYARGVAA